MCKHVGETTYEVNMRQVFPAGGEAGRWILALMAAVNDVNYVNGTLVDKLSGSSNGFEAIYFFRLSVSHLREAIQLFVGKRVPVPKEIKRILDNDLSDGAKEQLKHLIAETQEGSMLQSVLFPIRNATFHYADLAGKFTAVLQEFEYGVMTRGPRRHSRFLLADEAVINLVYHDCREHDSSFESMLKYTARLTEAFTEISEAIIDIFMRRQPPGAVTRIDRE